MEHWLAAHRLDLLAVAALLAAGLALWPMGPIPGGPPMDISLPWWASPGDVVLSGPDAGEWAASAVAFAQGRYEDLGHHRMPTWPLLVGGLMALVPDVALAGHLLNHLLALALGPVIYLLARPGAGRGLALGAALVCATAPPLVSASRTLGADAALILLLPLSLLLALWAGRRWWLAPLAGLVATLCALSHYTALAFPLPALILLIAAGRGRRWERLLGPALFVGSGALAAGLIFRVFPPPSGAGLGRALGESISAGAVDSGAANTVDWTGPLRILAAGGLLGHASTGVLYVMRWILPPWLPWGLGLSLPWLGLIGRLSPPRPRSVPGLARAAAAGLALGLPLLLGLAPLPLLAATVSDRYAHSLIPLAALLTFRGLALPLSLIDWGLAGRWRRWPSGALGLALGLAIGASQYAGAREWIRPLPPRTEDVSAWQLGRVIAARFPPGGHAACPVREANVLAGRDYCPHTSCPFGLGEQQYWFCLSIMGEECEGEGALPYVVSIKSRRDERSEARAAMDAWVLERWGSVGEVHTEDLDAWVVALPRGELPALERR